MRSVASGWVSVVALFACTQAPASSTPVPVQAPAATVAATPPAIQAAPTPEQIAARDDSLRQDRLMYVNRLLEQIKGNEDKPAEEVFQNVKALDGVPARQFLAVMNQVYSGALGVSCSHCHVTSDFSSEDKPAKQVTREMIAMVSTINNDMLRKMEGIQSSRPGVNCSTCHVGRTRPGTGPQRDQMLQQQQRQAN